MPGLVPLAANYTHKKEAYLRVAGYGATKAQIINNTAVSSDPAMDLMQTYLQAEGQNDCPILTGPNAIVSNVSKICMFNNDSSILHGDSGGPSLAKGKDGQWYQVGINTNILPIAEWNLIVGLAEDVSFYCPWIEKATKNEVKCQTFEPVDIIPE
uniref:Peptidase S1 domain-containing protein n=1 Tax=Panagrolaimus sp. JU765 TaxID=591449 RepID=A0AC34R6T6_9BILA